MDSLWYFLPIYASRNTTIHLGLEIQSRKKAKKYFWVPLKSEKKIWENGFSQKWGKILKKNFFWIFYNKKYKLLFQCPLVVGLRCHDQNDDLVQIGDLAKITKNGFSPKRRKILKKKVFHVFIHKNCQLWYCYSKFLRGGYSGQKLDLLKYRVQLSELLRATLGVKGGQKYMILTLKNDVQR